MEGVAGFSDGNDESISITFAIDHGVEEGEFRILRLAVHEYHAWDAVEYSLDDPALYDDS